MTEIQMRAVAFREGDTWVIQGLEYDIAAHASDPATVPMAFMRAMVENACICQALGRGLLEGIKPAPSRFHDMFNRAKATLGSVDPEDLPDPRFPVRPEIRLLANA